MSNIKLPKVVIVHGTKGSPNGNWFPWLRKELECRGHTVCVPCMPTPEGQTLASWRAEFVKQVGELNSNTILVGHSVGAVFLLRLLETATSKVGTVVLVSGFLGELGLPEYDQLNRSFVADPYNWHQIRENGGKFICIFSDNDPYVPFAQSMKLADSLQVAPVIISGGGHLNLEFGFKELPAVLAAIQGKNDTVLPLRPNVCMLVFNREGKLFLGERHKEAGIWQFPQGGVEAEFSLEENVIRELEEELGVKPSHLRIVKKLESTHDYEFGTPPPYAKGRWRGQSQTFWLVEFLGADSDIKLEQANPEFSTWRWCTVSEVKELAEPKRLPGYLNPLKEFGSYLNTRPA